MPCLPRSAGCDRWRLCGPAYGIGPQSFSVTFGAVHAGLRSVSRQVETARRTGALAWRRASGLTDMQCVGRVNLRIVKPMDASEPRQADRRWGSVDRRGLFRLTASLGMAATIDACSHKSARNSSPASASGPSPAVGPNAGTSLTTGRPPSGSTFAPPAPRPAAATLLCRDSWGARPARPGGRPNLVTRATVHHSATVLGANSNAPSRFRQDQLYHQDQLGWIDIAYHVGIDHEGNIYQLRSPEIVGDTATEYDTSGHFLVLCEGNFDEEAVPEPMFNSTALVCAWAARRYNFTPDMVAGHRDLAQTACPGANLYARIVSGELRRQVTFFLENGGVDLQLLCGAEALARVAAVEAGN